MEWWNIGVLVLKAMIHLLTPLSREIFPINHCPIFLRTPVCRQAGIIPSFQYSVRTWLWFIVERGGESPGPPG